MSAAQSVGFSTRDLIEGGRQRLEAAGVESAGRQAEWLLSHLLEISRTELYLYESVVSEDALAGFWEKIEQRACGVPLQYLIGAASFYGRDFLVAPGVFIPRPETEAVVKALLARLTELHRRCGRTLRILDVGSGSGCIAITLAKELPACIVVGVELSWDALVSARQNAGRQGLTARLQWVQGRWLSAIGVTLDAIVANPPYIPSGQVAGLPLDVRQEPRRSLDGGPDGLEPYRVLVSDAGGRLAPGGLFAVECGDDQVESIRRLLRDAGWALETEAIMDLAGRPRGVIASKIKDQKSKINN